MGYYVVQWSAGVLPKLLVIVGVSFLITLALYDLVVKRTNVTRFLFGMRLKGRRIFVRRERESNQA